MIDCLSFIIR